MFPPCSLTSTSLALGFLSALCLASCGDSAEAGQARKEIREAFDATKDLVVESFEDLREAARPRLQALEQDLEQLRDELARRGEDAQGTAADALRSIEQDLARAGDKLEQARVASQEKLAEVWQEIQDLTARARKAIEDTRGGSKPVGGESGGR